MIKQAFCWLYNQWLSKAVDSKDDPLVRVIDAIAGSECKYCMGVRLGMIGMGLGLFSWYGLGLIALAILLTLGEKHLLCDNKS
jgi:hypothetical protein